MSRVRRIVVSLVLVLFSPQVAAVVAAQAPAAAPPPRIWDVQLGASFIGTNGNSDTSTFGGDFGLNRRWPLWRLEATALVSRFHSSSRSIRKLPRVGTLSV